MINRKTPVNRLIALFVVVVILILLPLIFENPYRLHLFIMVFISTCLGMSFSMLWSTGLITLGIAAFYAIGAYASALLVIKLGLSFWLALPLAVIITGIIALVLGLVFVRGAGFSFIILTMVFGVVVVEAVGQIQLFGGWAGFIGIPHPDPLPIPFRAPIEFITHPPNYYLMLFLLLLIVLIFNALYTSRIGRAWKAIKLNPHLARSLGINVYRYRLLAFVIASSTVGAVGSFYTSYYQSIQPTVFGGWMSILLQLYSVLGGLSFYILGPALGATIMTFVPELLRITSVIEPLITGALLIVLILFLPSGILGAVRNLWVERKFPRSDTPILAQIVGTISTGIRNLRR
jgi:branched-chain amino acid transport system permease protein